MIQELEKYILSLKCNIVCNSSICSIIKDFILFKGIYMDMEQIGHDTYLIGHLDGFEVILDVSMSIFDNRILDTSGNVIMSVNMDDFY